MHLLDTDTLTHLQAGHTRVTQRLREEADPEVGITVISRIEMLRGRFDFMMKAANVWEDASAGEAQLGGETHRPPSLSFTPAAALRCAGQRG
jgi:hypothetical protein